MPALSLPRHAFAAIECCVTRLWNVSDRRHHAQLAENARIAAEVWTKPTVAEEYATGEWSLSRLAHELEIRGLTQRPTAKRAARPLNAKKLALVLHNPYYVGTVTWRGLQFDGKHPQLVSLELFAQVQAVLVAHRNSGERSYRRKHYLDGALRGAQVRGGAGC